MRRFELLLLFACLFSVLWPVVFGVRPRRGIVAGALVAGLVAQLQVEGYRWQLLPLYVTAVGLAVGDVLFIDRGLRWTNRVSRAVFGVIGLALAVAPAVVLPVPTLPEPPGPARIGTVSVLLTDTDREETYGSSPGGSRRFMAQVWYPAIEGDPGAALPWSEDWDIVAPAMSRRLGFPGWFLDHTRYVEAHAIAEALPAPGQYPVVIYSHGWTGFRTIAVNQIESLASSGYIVIAPDHAYGAIASRFPDGDVIEYDPSALPDEETVGLEEHLAAADDLIEVFAEDLVTILDAIDGGPEGGFGALAANMDPGRIGLYGHSTGGGAVVRVCLLDERCDALLGMDPWVEPLPARVKRVDASRPQLFMRSEDWKDTGNDAVLRGIAERGETTTYWLGIAGTGHNDFVVTPLISPLAFQLGLKGPIKAGRVLPIIDNYLIGFFDVYLQGTGTAALDTIAFEEVSVEVIGP